MLKICSRCKQELPVTCFSRNKAEKDGLCHACKDCCSAYNKAYRTAHRAELIRYLKDWRTKNAGEVRRKAKEKYDRDPSVKRGSTKRYRKTEQGKLARIKEGRRYRQTHPDLVSAVSKRWRKKNAEKPPATAAVNNAVRAGRLSKPDACSVCGQYNQHLHGHHYLGYNKSHWFDVLWVCAQCHHNIHNQHKE